MGQTSTFTRLGKGFRRCQTDAGAGTRDRCYLIFKSNVHGVRRPLLCRLFWALLEHVLRDRYGGHDVRPAGVEEQVREHFRRLRFRQAVIHRAVQMKRDLRDLARSNER